MALSQTFNQDASGDIGISAFATTAAPTYAANSQAALSLNLSGMLRVDGSGVTQPISAATLPLPTGASTAALQTTINSNITTVNSNLTTISGQLPTTLGQTTSANSLSVVIASDQVVHISATALPLPAGAATSALQTSGNATLTAISGQLPATLGVHASAASLSVVIANDDIIPVSLPSVSSATQTSVSSSASSVTLLASNAARKGYIIFNDSTQVLYISFAASATTSAYSVKLFPNSAFSSDYLYTGVISGIWAAANGAAKMTEF